MDPKPRREEILDRAGDLFATSGVSIGVAEIAAACGIQPGSLYHHFASKERILAELVGRYRADLALACGATVAAAPGATSDRHFEGIVAFAEAIAAVAIRNRAALIQTFLDPSPAADGMEALLLSPIERAALRLLEAARGDGHVKPDVDLSLLAVQLCQSMLNIAFGTIGEARAAQALPRLKCLMLLRGIVARPSETGGLEDNPARRAADAAVARWRASPAEGPSPLVPAARAEFSRRGYAATTIRQIASAARMSMASLYREVGGKSDLLRLVMQPFITEVLSSWTPVLTCEASAAQKLDALLWLNLNLLDRFGEEFRIQLAWLRENSPPEWSSFHEVTTRLRQITVLLVRAERSGAFRCLGSTQYLRASCLLELTFIPERITRAVALEGALGHARRTLLAGALYSSG